MREADLRRHVRISYAKVTEPRARGLVHFHAIIRLDHPTNEEWRPPALDIPTAALIDAVKAAASRTCDTVTVGTTRPSLCGSGPRSTSSRSGPAPGSTARS